MILLVISAIFLSVNAVLGQDPSFNDFLKANRFSFLADAFNYLGLDISGDDFPEALYLFAPNNDAFKNIDPIPQLLLSPGWEIHLLNFLVMHLAPETDDIADLTDGEELVALNGEIILASVSNSSSLELFSPYSFTTGAVAVLPLKASSDGVFVELNDVLLPSYIDIDIVTRASSFPILTELLTFSGLLDMDLFQNFAITLFAPTDDAFLQLDADVLAYYRSNSTAAAELLLGHMIIETVVNTLSIVSGPMNYTSGVGGNLYFAAQLLSNNFVFTINNVNIQTPDILAWDGIVHVIDSVLEVEVFDAPAPAPTPVTLPPTRAPKMMMMRMMTNTDVFGMRMRMMNMRMGKMARNV